MYTAKHAAGTLGRGPGPVRVYFTHSLSSLYTKYTHPYVPHPQVPIYNMKQEQEGTETEKMQRGNPGLTEADGSPAATACEASVSCQERGLQSPQGSWKVPYKSQPVPAEGSGYPMHEAWPSPTWGSADAGLLTGGHAFRQFPAPVQARVPPQHPPNAPLHRLSLYLLGPSQRSTVHRRTASAQPGPHPMPEGCGSRSPGSSWKTPLTFCCKDPRETTAGLDVLDTRGFYWKSWGLPCDSQVGVYTPKGAATPLRGPPGPRLRVAAARGWSPCRTSRAASAPRTAVCRCSGHPGPGTCIFLLIWPEAWCCTPCSFLFNPRFLMFFSSQLSPETFPAKPRFIGRVAAVLMA